MGARGQHCSHDSAATPALAGGVGGVARVPHPPRSLPTVAIRPAGVKAVFENNVGKLIGSAPSGCTTRVREADEHRRPAFDKSMGARGQPFAHLAATPRATVYPVTRVPHPPRSLPTVAIRPAGIKAVFENDVGKFIGAFGAHDTGP